jgi:DNA-binding HxlR family transcriptional regulator
VPRLVQDLYRSWPGARIRLTLQGMGSSYYQFCPVAKAMELLDERWTMLIVRELVTGSQHFNELRRGVPRMSPTLLSKRLSQLVRAGIAERHDDNGDVRYTLTTAGRELQPVVEALGIWGTRWIGDIGDEDLDPKLLLWDMHRNIDHHAVPAGRTTIHFAFPDTPAHSRNWWLVITAGQADVCDADPGFPVAITWSRSGAATLTGTQHYAAAMSPSPAPKNCAAASPAGSRSQPSHRYHDPSPPRSAETGRSSATECQLTSPRQNGTGS